MASKSGKITISEAARTGFASRPTIHRAIKAGKLSVDKVSSPGKVLIEVSELVRVYGEPAKVTPPADAPIDTLKQIETLVELAALKERLAAVERERDQLNEEKGKAEQRAEDARLREEWLKKQLDTHTALLAAPQASDGLLGRIFGRGDRKGGGNGP